MFVTVPQMASQLHILDRKEGEIPPPLFAFRRLKGYLTANQVFVIVKWEANNLRGTVGGNMC